MLRGSSDSLTLSELLALLADGHKSGRLQIDAARHRAVLLFDHGRLLAVRDRGVRVAWAEIDGDTPSWPDEAVDLGAELVQAKHLTFLFQPESGFEHDGADHVDGHPLGWLDAAKERRQRWLQIKEVIPGLHARPHLIHHIADDEVVSDIEWRVLHQMHTGRSVTTVARRAGMSPLQTCEVLMGLIQRGLVELETIASAPVTGRDAGSPPPGESVAIVRGEGSS